MYTETNEHENITVIIYFYAIIGIIFFSIVPDILNYRAKFGNYRMSYQSWKFHLSLIGANARYIEISADISIICKNPCPWTIQKTFTTI